MSDGLKFVTMIWKMVPLRPLSGGKQKARTAAGGTGSEKMIREVKECKKV